VLLDQVWEELNRMENPLWLPTMLTDKPIKFSYDPDTGLVLMLVAGEMEYFHPILQQKQTKEWNQVIGLTPEASRVLLAVLPELQSLLEQAVKGPTKPRSVQ
jgi:hypothetical protein